MLCDDLEGWRLKSGDICIQRDAKSHTTGTHSTTASSLCCTAETNNTEGQLHSKFKKPDQQKKNNPHIIQNLISKKVEIFSYPTPKPYSNPKNGKT